MHHSQNNSLLLNNDKSNKKKLKKVQNSKSKILNRTKAMRKETHYFLLMLTLDLEELKELSFMREILLSNLPKNSLKDTALTQA